MKQTNLSSLSKQHVHTPVSLRKPLRCGFTILLCSCLLFGAAQCRAQETQNAAEAARQERARKEQPKPSKHVYTEDDLGRPKILTPEDEERFAAQRRQLLSSPDQQTQIPLDASSDLPQLPLGDVARRYHDAKRAVQPPTPFHLPFDEPAFAAPVVSIPIVAPPRPNFSPVRPSLAPSHPHAVPAPSLLNSAPLHRVDPFARRSTPAAPSSFAGVAPTAREVQPSVSRPTPVLVDPRPNLIPGTSSKVAPPKFASRRFAPLATQLNLAPSNAVPAAPAPSVTPEIVVAPGTASAPSSPLHTVTVQPGDSLWKLAQRNLGRGSRWHELLAANPGIVDPNRLATGTEVIVPAVTGLKSDVKLTVQQGDTLSKLAQATYGRAAAWRCIAQANPEIADVNRIYEGQQLLLPFACRH